MRVTLIGNKKPSEKLRRMLLDLRNDTDAWLDKIEEVRQQAHKEGFNEEQTKLLLKQFLGGSLNERRIRYLLYEVPRAKEQKKLRENPAEIGNDANMQIEPEAENIVLDYEVKIPDQVLEEDTNQLEQQEDTGLMSEEFKPDYAVENLKLQLDQSNNKIIELTAQNKNLKEKLEARTRVLPSNNFPAIQGNTLRTKAVVNQIFREVIQLKGSKVIYANVVIDISQNKYVRLEPM